LLQRLDEGGKRFGLLQRLVLAEELQLAGPMGGRPRMSANGMGNPKG
jgi:hypothetical protein